MDQAKAHYSTARNALITAVMNKDVDGIKTAYADRKRAMAARITLVHQAKALAKQAKANAKK